MKLILLTAIFLLLINVIPISLPQIKSRGYILPSEGHIHVLFIFAQFPDDSYLPDDPRWKKGDEPQRMKDRTWIDSTWNENATPDR